MRTGSESGVHQVSAGGVETGVRPLAQGLGDFLLVQLVADRGLIPQLDQGLVTLLEHFDTRLRLTLTLHHLHFLQELLPLLPLRLLPHVLLPELPEFLLEHELVGLLLHELLDEAATRLELLHDLSVLLPHAVLLVRLPMMLTLYLSMVLVLLGLELFLLLFLDLLVLLLLLLDVAGEFDLLLHPLLEAFLRELSTLPHDFVVVILNHP